MKLFSKTTLILSIVSTSVFAQTKVDDDPLIRVPKEAWRKYFQDYHDTADVHHEDHAAYHNVVIATDRPDQTETPFLVPPGYFQIETGAIMEKHTEDDIKFTSTTYNTSLFKYGVSKNLELRLIEEYLGERRHQLYHSRREDKLYNGFNSMAIGSKIFICDESKYRPQISLITHLQLPYLGDKINRPGFIAPRFRFLFQHALSNTFSFSYNLGAEWDGDHLNTTGIYTASLGINLFTNTSMFVEAYGFVTEHGNNDNEFDGAFINDHRIDGGFTHVITNNLQVDISSGFGLSKISPTYFISGGVSWRFAVKKSSKLKG